ncbi:MAG: 4Fe-4S binding protein [Clostridiaceae bacterium]|nr:4Fe-4S binding protein [Clostridiaceae bacterium]
MQKVLTKPDRCKQCGLCIASCPTKSISFSEDINKDGYCYTMIDHEKCIACGICYTVCPDGVYEILGDK